MPLLSNEFTNSLDDNRVRPYTVGLKRHEETLATIVVYKESEGQVELPNRTNYLDADDFSKQVQPIFANVPEEKRQESKANVIATGTPRVPSGDIPAMTLDGNLPYYGVFNNFSLLNVQEANEQIVKMHVNFGSSWNAFFFGEKPRVYQFSGFFIDSSDYPYYQEFMVAYDLYLAGRKAIENEYQTTFVYDGRIIDGYMLDIQTQHTAADQLIKNFTFTVLVRGSFWIRNNVVSLSDFGYETDAQRETVFNGLSNLYRLRRYQATGDIQVIRGSTINQNEPQQPAEDFTTGGAINDTGIG